MGSGGSGGGMGGFMTGRATADLLTRTTAIFAAGFMLTSLILAIIAGSANVPTSILDQKNPAEKSSTKADKPVTPVAPIAK